MNLEDTWSRNELPTDPVVYTEEFHYYASPTATTNMSLWLNATEDMKFNESCKQSYLNVSCELPKDYAVPLYGYVMPFLLIITIIANTLIVVVLSKRHMRTPTNVVLMAMALCDMFTLLFPAPWLIYMFTFGNHYKPLYPISVCYAWNMMHEVSYIYSIGTHQYVYVN